MGQPDSVVRLSLQSVEAAAPILTQVGSDWLSPSESGRYQTLRSTSRRLQFLAARYWTRHCLHTWLGGAWQDYALTAADNSPPGLIAGPAGADWPEVKVSISHSGDWVACALAYQAVGVDVQCTRKVRDIPALSAWIDPELNLAEFQSTPISEQADWFYAQWTLREAWVKQVSTAKLAGEVPPRFAACTAQEAEAIVMAQAGLVWGVYPATAQSLQWLSPALHPNHCSYWRRA